MRMKAAPHPLVAKLLGEVSALERYCEDLRRQSGHLDLGGVRTPVDDWGTLRRALQRLAALIGKTTLRPLPSSLQGVQQEQAAQSPEQKAWFEARFQELEHWEKTVRSVEHDLDGRLRAVENAWAQTESDLDRLYRGWSLVRKAALGEPQAEPQVPPEFLFEHVLEVGSLWAKLLRHERKARVERAWLARTWRWLRDVSLPAWEARTRGTPLEPAVSRFRARLAQLDRYALRLESERSGTETQGLEAKLRASVAAELRRLRSRLHRRYGAMRDRAAQERKAQQERLRFEAERLLSGLKELGAEPSLLVKDMDRLLQEVVEARAQASRTRLLEEERDRLLGELQASHGVAEDLRNQLSEQSKRQEERMRGLQEELARLRAVLEAPSRAVGATEGEAAQRPDPLWATMGERLLGGLEGALRELGGLYRTLPLAAGLRLRLRPVGDSLALMRDLARSLSILAGLDPEDLRTEPPGPLVEAALRGWEGAFRLRRIVLVRKLPPDLPKCRIAAEPLSVALYQILRNAYEAMPRGGSLLVEASREGADGPVALRFVDSGPGLSPAALDALFVPARAPRRGRLGLGLALTRRIVGRLGGSVRVENLPQGGACVSVRLKANP